jgi:hypothetical protein
MVETFHLMAPFCSLAEGDETLLYLVGGLYFKGQAQDDIDEKKDKTGP